VDAWYFYEYTFFTQLFAPQADKLIMRLTVLLLFGFFSIVVQRFTQKLYEADIALLRTNEELEQRVESRTLELQMLNTELKNEIRERIRAEEQSHQSLRELKTAMANVKTLEGLLPMCAWCKKIRDESGDWNQLESYLSKHAEVDVSHGICPECSTKVREQFSKKS